MTYTLRDIPDALWKQVQLNAEMSGLTIRKYILMTLEYNNVKFKIRDSDSGVVGKADSGVQLAEGVDAKRFDKR